MQSSSNEENETYQSFEELRRSLLPENGDENNMTDCAPTLSTSEHEIGAAAVLPRTNVSSSSSLWIPMISNFSTSYNVVNISMVLPIMEHVHDATSRDEAACASSLLAGMIVGQLVGGALGDSRLGRIGALRLVMALQIIASIATASVGLFVTDKDNSNQVDIFLRLAALRFFLGIGCGGVYPLAAVLSAEQGKLEAAATSSAHQTSHDGEEAGTQQNANDKEDDSVHRVVLTFGTQGMGFVAVPTVAVILLYSTTNLEVIWRLILGLGALPGIILMILQCRSSCSASAGSQLVPTEDPIQEEHGFEVNTEAPEAPSDINNSDQEERDGVLMESYRGSWLQTLFHEPGLGRKVLGTAGTWFLFDVVFYGNTIFQPLVVKAAFGGQSHDNGSIELLRETATDTLILTCIALPGYAVAGIVIGNKTCCITQTPRYVMLQGFAAMSVLYATIGANWSYLRGYPALLVFLYGMTFFFANYGPNTTTFILPSLIFQQEHRATWNGVSAAAGKLGALTGATFFKPAEDNLGDGAVMIICALVAVVGFFLTCFAIPTTQKEGHSRIQSNNDEDEVMSGELAQA
jgi:PHS family inorganic phosphate transporter-like MFS transporter